MVSFLRWCLMVSTSVYVVAGLDTGNVFGSGMRDQNANGLGGASAVIPAASNLDGSNALAHDAPHTEAVSASSTPPVIGTAPTAASSSSASLEMPPVTAATSEDFHVPNTNTTLSIRYKPQNPILSVAMSGILDDAKNDLEQKMDKDGDGWISTSRWTYVKAAYDCVISAEERPEPGPTGLPQHLTYGILQVTMLGLRAALFDKGLYHGADFDIWDQQWGWVASGAISSWTLGVENVAQS